GGEVSSWGAFEEFLLGKLQVPEAAFSINLLWSSHYPKKEVALEQAGILMPEVRRLLASRPAPSLVADPMRFEVLDIAAAFNHAPKGDGWDLSGLKPGRGYSHDLPYAIADPARGPAVAVVARRPAPEPTRVPIPVTGRWASLLFLQSSTGGGRPSLYAADPTHFPHEPTGLSLAPFKGVFRATTVRRPGGLDCRACALRAAMNGGRQPRTWAGIVTH